MAKIKTQCHLCGHTTKSETALVICPLCRTSQYDRREIEIKRTAAKMITGTMKGWNGGLFLTNYRLFYYKTYPVGASAAGWIGGALGELIVSLITRAKVEDALAFSLTPNEIAYVALGNRGMLGNDLIINTISGETYRFQTYNSIEWEAAINAAKVRY